MRSQCVGDIGECSPDLHSLLSDTVDMAAERHWGEAGATSARAARSVYTAIYRHRLGCEVALHGSRLRLTRAYLVSGGDGAGTGYSGMRPTLDPADADHFTAAAPPVLSGARGCRPAALDSFRSAARRRHWTPGPRSVLVLSVFLGGPVGGARFPPHEPALVCRSHAATLSRKGSRQRLACHRHGHSCSGRLTSGFARATGTVRTVHGRDVCQDA